jgi:threonine dehydrogenase-like Zn-dependent dehydrogenase
MSMQALRYYPSIPKYLLARQLGKRYPVSALPLRLETLEPPVERPGWARVQVRACGMCGSDLALLYGKNSPRLSPFFSFPAVLGHEILGEVEGTRVVVNPTLACLERDLQPCRFCAHGEDNFCQNIAEGDLAPGLLGFCRDLPGGWGETLTARPERLHPITDSVPDSRAVLAEPLAVVLRGVRLAFQHQGIYRWPERILLIGAGSIGLITIKVLRLLGYAGELHGIARYPTQREMAQHLGADHLHASSQEAARHVGARTYPAIIGPPGWRGGFDVVIDAAGSASSLTEAAWTTLEGGTLLLLGAPGEVKHDFSPHWFREIRFLGSYVYSPADFKDAVELLDEAHGLEQLVTHQFPLAAWRDALTTLQERKALKVLFTPPSRRTHA